MNSPTPASGGDSRFSSDFLSRDGFPSILWEVLNSAGYPTPPLYTVQLYEEHRVPRCPLNITRHVLSFLDAQISSLTAPVIPSQPPTRSEWTLEGNIVVYSIGPSAKPTGYGIYFPHIVSSLSFSALLGSLPITSQFVTKTSS